MELVDGSSSTQPSAEKFTWHSYSCSKCVRHFNSPLSHPLRRQCAGLKSLMLFARRCTSQQKSLKPGRSILKTWCRWICRIWVSPEANQEAISTCRVVICLWCPGSQWNSSFFFLFYSEAVAWAKTPRVSPTEISYVPICMIWSSTQPPGQSLEVVTSRRPDESGPRKQWTLFPSQIIRHALQMGWDFLRMYPVSCTNFPHWSFLITLEKNIWLQRGCKQVARMKTSQHHSIPLGVGLSLTFSPTDLLGLALFCPLQCASSNWSWENLAWTMWAAGIEVFRLSVDVAVLPSLWDMHEKWVGTSYTCIQQLCLAPIFPCFPIGYFWSLLRKTSDRRGAANRWQGWRQRCSIPLDVGQSLTFSSTCSTDLLGLALFCPLQCASSNWSWENRAWTMWTAGIEVFRLSMLM